MKRKYYELFSCDEWKSHASMSLVGVFNFTKLKRIIKDRVKKDKFEFGRDIKEIDKMTWHEIEVALAYGYIQELELNEVVD